MVQFTRKGRPILHRKRNDPSSPASFITPGVSQQGNDDDDDDDDDSGGNGRRPPPKQPLVNMQPHDRTKQLPIPLDQPHPFLQKLGMQTADGRIKAGMNDKFRSVFQYLYDVFQGFILYFSIFIMYFRVYFMLA